MHLIGWLSLHCLVVFFSGALICSVIWPIFFFASAHLLRSKGRSLGYLPGRGNTSLCCDAISVGGAQEGTLPFAQLSASFQSFPHYHKQIGPFWCWFLGGWFCVCSRTLWVSPANSPVRLGVFSCCLNSHRFFQSEALRLYFSRLETWVVQSVSLPICSSWFIHTQMWGCPLP